MKILSADQIRALDAITIKEEPITSIDLMERACISFVKWFTVQYPNAKETPSIHIFCGIGNNGGDGLAIGRLLQDKLYKVTIYICQISANTSNDFNKNRTRLPYKSKVIELNESSDFPPIPPNAILIDAIFGSGLNRAITGHWAALIHYLNLLPNTKIAIDIPSGLFADQSTSSISFNADYTFSFELPKLAFFFPENQHIVGECIIQPIGLNQDYIHNATTPFHFINKEMVKGMLKKRKKFDHKGTFGHALLIAGSYGKAGAALLAAKACLRSGAGLVSIHAPKSIYEVLQIGLPEAMVSVDPHEYYFSQVPDIKKYKIIGIGCGLDQKPSSKNALMALIETANSPLVLDADALNILSKSPSLLLKLPVNSILTPHPKEFERLFGTTNNDFERNTLLREQAKKLNCYIVLKGANTCIACLDGNAYFNTTGNPGMATGGTGDVLTGMITGFMAQNYTAKEASILGVYLHGLAGDVAAKELGHESLLASDLIECMGKAFKEVKKQ